MISEISKDEWNEFFGRISRSLEGWDTKVEVLSPDIGAQTLSSGLPLGGVTLEQKNNRARIDLTLGADAESHITHTVEQPSKVAFEADSMQNGGILDIEDQAGSKTLITFLPPIPMSIKYERTEIVIVN